MLSCLYGAERMGYLSLLSLGRSTGINYIPPINLTFKPSLSFLDTRLPYTLYKAHFPDNSADLNSPS